MLSAERLEQRLAEIDSLLGALRIERDALVTEMLTHHQLSEVMTVRMDKDAL